MRDLIPFKESRNQLTIVEQNQKDGNSAGCNLGTDTSVNTSKERKGNKAPGGAGGAGGSGNWVSLEEARSMNASGGGAGRAAQKSQHQPQERRKAAVPGT